MLLLLFYVSVPTKVITLCYFTIGYICALQKSSSAMLFMQIFCCLINLTTTFLYTLKQKTEYSIFYFVFVFFIILLWESLDMWLCCPLLYIYWTTDNVPLTEWMYWDPLYIHYSSCFTVFSFEKMRFSCVPKSVIGACKEKISEQIH